MKIEKQRLLNRDTVNSLVVRVHGLNRLFVTTNRVLIPFTSCKNMTDREKKKLDNSPADPIRRQLTC